MGRLLIINLLILIIQLSLVKAGFKYASSSPFNTSFLLKNSISQDHFSIQNKQNNNDFSPNENVHFLVQKSIFQDKIFKAFRNLKFEKFITLRSGLSPPLAFQIIT